MSSYSEKNIERFAGLAGIRKKPTPYIGPTDSDGLWTLWREPADNAVDQALAGRNDTVHLVQDTEKNVYWVADNGEGIPVGEKVFENERGKKEKLSTFYVVTGLTHGGSNFSGDTISRGTHGIGIKATNAMSTTFKVWTHREGKWWAIEYKSGKLTKDVHKSSPPKMPHGIKAARGTVVRFSPELPLFRKGVSMDPQNIRNWCELTSYLVPKLKVKYTNAKGKTVTLVTKGPSAFITKQLETLKVTQTGKTFTFSSKEADIAVAFTDAEGSDLVHAYTNGLRNKEGGEHLKALVDALAKSLASLSKKDKNGKLRYTPSDLRDGLIGLVNYKISAPQFNNQPKDKLIDERVYAIAFPQFLKAWSEFWKTHKSMAKAIIDRAETLRSKTNEFLHDKKLIKNVKAATKGLAAKLADVSGNKFPVERRELYLVEGDSAGGTAKLARDRAFQATFACRGKPLNVMDRGKDKVQANKEVVGIFASLGLELGKKNPLDTIRFGKIVLLADPDVDGRHINCLWLALFWQYLPSLFKDGRIFMVVSPEYMARYRGKVYFGMTKEAVYKKAGTDKVDVRHIKGWGEVSAEDMRPLAFEIGHRRLWRILPPKDKKGVLEFSALMGKDSKYRQKLLGVV